MSTELYALAAVLAMVLFMTAADAVLSGPALFIGTVSAGVVAALLWIYCPLPNRTFSFGMAPESGYWGFTAPGNGDDPDE